MNFTVDGLFDRKPQTVDTRILWVVWKCTEPKKTTAFCHPLPRAFGPHDGRQAPVLKLRVQACTYVLRILSRHAVPKTPAKMLAPPSPRSTARPLLGLGFEVPPAWGRTQRQNCFCWGDFPLTTSNFRVRFELCHHKAGMT